MERGSKQAIPQKMGLVLGRATKGDEVRWVMVEGGRSRSKHAGNYL
jgi:hypothetical protein